MTVYWVGDVEKCDTCGNCFADTFYDGKTKFGPWANMCPSCFTCGPGVNTLGTGFGQKYEKQSDGRFMKTEG